MNSLRQRIEKKVNKKGTDFCFDLCVGHNEPQQVIKKVKEKEKIALTQKVKSLNFSKGIGNSRESRNKTSYSSLIS